MNGNCTRMPTSYIQQILGEISCKTTAVRPPSLKPSKYDDQDMGNTAAEARMNSFVGFSYGSLHVDVPVLVDLLELHQLCVDTG